MGEYSNVDEVADALNKIVEGFGFDLTVDGKELGRHCVEIVATDIQDHAADGIGSDGEWQANTDSDPPGHGYASYKARVYGVIESPNVRTGQMLSLTSLSNATIGHEIVDMEYGIGQVPRDGVKGRPVKNADTKITDREKAGYAHDGQGPHGTERPFYVIHDTAADNIQGVCQHRLDKFADDIWGK